MTEQTVKGNIIDLYERTIFYGNISIADGKIVEVNKQGSPKSSAPYILPGFIDAHIHIESSMLVPSEFARLAVVHGTVATVSDPHEIANVCGIEGVRYMIDEGAKQPFKFFFGASPCVPATSFETAGAQITSEHIEKLFRDDKLYYLSEMMNYPGVLAGDQDVLDKIAVAKKYNKPVDGHAPGLRDEEAKRYIEAGISTDHECFTLEEALDKIKYGMKIIIREGSAAKNYEALHPLLKTHPELVMFCSDDKHPDSLVSGHINQLVVRSIKLGYDLFDVLAAACLHPVEHYGIPVGLLREGDAADFIIIDNLDTWNIEATYIDGIKVAENGKTLLSKVPHQEINHFDTSIKKPDDFIFLAEEGKLRVIEALDGQLITNEIRVTPKVCEGRVVPDIEQDILKISVVNRYKNVKPAVAFVKNFGLKKGAIASSVAHDSHNIIAVGVDDESLSEAVNAVIRHKGGISVYDGDEVHVLPLPIAGLMSVDDGYDVAELYSSLDAKAKALGSLLGAPFMTLSFLALLVIPNLKLSDRGLFDCTTFSFAHPFVDRDSEGMLTMDEMAERIKSTSTKNVIPVKKKDILFGNNKPSG
jgi:adenine deaminase